MPASVIMLGYENWVFKMSHKSKVKATKIRFLKLTTCNTLHVSEINFYSKFYIIKIVCLFVCFYF